MMPTKSTSMQVLPKIEDSKTLPEKLSSNDVKHKKPLPVLTAKEKAYFEEAYNQARKQDK